MHPERVRCTRLTRHVVVGLVVDKSSELMSKESTESTGDGGSCSSLMSDSADCCGIEMSVVTAGFFFGLPIGYPSDVRNKLLKNSSRQNIARRKHRLQREQAIMWGVIINRWHVGCWATEGFRSIPYEPV